LDRGFVVWITGLPCSGKTTIGTALRRRLDAILLDGDDFRKTVSKGLGYSREGRLENLRRAAMVAKFLADSGRNVVACFITPYDEIRREIAMAIDRFVLVYARCPLEVCMERDQKGLYEKALRGEIEDFTGITAPYEEPHIAIPNVVLDTDTETVEQSVGKVLAFLDEKGLWKIKATLFIGRFSPPHKGHKYIFDSVLNNGGKIVIAVRDTPIGSDNPFSAHQRQKLLEELYHDNPNVQVIVIPDIDTVCLGRGVGYKVMAVPESIEQISATKIRERGDYSDVPEEIVGLAEAFLDANEEAT